MVNNVFSSRLDETHTEQHRTSGDYRGQVTAVMIRGQSRTYSDDQEDKAGLTVMIRGQSRTYSDDKRTKQDLQ